VLDSAEYSAFDFRVHVKIFYRIVLWRTMCDL